MARARGSTLVVVDLYGCEMPLNDVARCESEIRKIIVGAGMTIRVSDSWEDNGAYNFFFSLQESHLHIDVHIETWPEEGHVKVVVDLCNYEENNRRASKKIAKKVSSLLKPKDTFTLVIPRGPHDKSSWKNVYKLWSHEKHLKGRRIK